MLIKSATNICRHLWSFPPVAPQSTHSPNLSIWSPGWLPGCADVVGSWVRGRCVPLDPCELEQTRYRSQPSRSINPKRRFPPTGVLKIERFLGKKACWMQRQQTGACRLASSFNGAKSGNKGQTHKFNPLGFLIIPHSPNLMVFRPLHTKPSENPCC